MNFLSLLVNRLKQRLSLMTAITIIGSLLVAGALILSAWVEKGSTAELWLIVVAVVGCLLLGISVFLPISSHHPKIR